LFHGFSAPLCTCVRGVTASRNRECYFAVHVHMSTSHDVLVERFRYTLYNWSKNRRSWSVPELSKKQRKTCCQITVNYIAFTAKLA